MGGISHGILYSYGARLRVSLTVSLFCLLMFYSSFLVYLDLLDLFACGVWHILPLLELNRLVLFCLVMSCLIVSLITLGCFDEHNCYPSAYLLNNKYLKLSTYEYYLLHLYWTYIYVGTVSGSFTVLGTTTAATSGLTGTPNCSTELMCYLHTLLKSFFRAHPGN